jgi:hypothetical protein
MMLLSLSGEKWPAAVTQAASHAQKYTAVFGQSVEVWKSIGPFARQT